MSEASYVVGYTATEKGADAVALGVRLARGTGARLDVVIVLHIEQRGAVVPTDAGYERFVREQAESWLAEIDVPDDIEVRRHVRYADSSSEGLTEAAHELGAALIVVGAARGGLLGRLSIGSVANELLHSSDVPVAIAPVGSRSIGEGHGISRVTAAVGTRSGSDALLASAVALAGAASAPLRLVSLVTLDLPGSVDTRLANRTGAAHAEEVLEAARAALPADVSASASVAAGDSIAEAMGELDWESDEIVVVGSSRLAQQGRLFLGATAAKVLRELSVPLIVVPRSTREGDRS